MNLKNSIIVLLLPHHHSTQSAQKAVAQRCKRYYGRCKSIYCARYIWGNMWEYLKYSRQKKDALHRFLHYGLPRSLHITDHCIKAAHWSGVGKAVKGQCASYR